VAIGTDWNKRGAQGVPGADFRFIRGNEKLTASCFNTANFSQTETNRRRLPAISLRLKRRFLYGKSRFHLYHYAGNNPLKYTDPDGNQTAEPPEEDTRTAARNWIIRNVVYNPFVPVSREMYSKGLSGDSSPYIRGPESRIAQKMKADLSAYVNTTILKRLSAGITSGTDGQTSWNDFDLKNSILSSEFNWTLDNYDSDTNTAYVTVNVKDRFDFNPSKEEGTRSRIAEHLTKIGRDAEMASYDVSVTYKIEFKVEMPKKESPVE
jgi:hypothetical protein